MRIIRPPAATQPVITRRLRGFPLRFRFNPGSAQGRLLYYRGLSEERLILKLRQLLKPGMTFIDVGANIGLFSVVAAHCVGPNGRVFAFEPQEGLAAPFWENMRLNRLSNVIHVPVALGSTSGTSHLFQISGNDVQATLRLRPDERSMSPGAVVPVRTLSDVLREHGVGSVDGMKIDVEGGDLDVLEGFRDWMVAAPPRFIFCEAIDRLLARFGHQSDDLIRFLRGYGYAVYQPLPTRWAPLAPEASVVANDVLAVRSAQRASARQG
jgi:FkbM family methyltransferase